MLPSFRGKESTTMVMLTKSGRSALKYRLASALGRTVLAFVLVTGAGVGSSLGAAASPRLGQPCCERGEADAVAALKKASANVDSTDKEIVDAENALAGSLLDAAKTLVTLGFDKSKLVNT